MRIGRKEAILALVATVIPWVSRRSDAQVIRSKVPTAVLSGPVPQAPDLADLQRRIAALETQLANQVAFTKDASGNLKLSGNANITVDAGFNLSIRAGSQASFLSGGNTSIRGAAIALN